MDKTLNPLDGDMDLLGETKSSIVRKLNPLNGRLEMVYSSDSYIQKVNPFTGDFDMVGGVASGIIQEVTGNGYINLTNAVAGHLIELKAYGGTEQRNLPTGYTQLEYIESDGNSYIDTEYKIASEKVDVKTKVSIPTLDDGKTICGSQISSTTGFGGLLFYNTSYGGLGGCFGSSYNNATYTSISANTIYNIEYNADNGNGSLSINGTTTTTTYTGTQISDKTWYVFASNGGRDTYRISAKVYYIQLYDNGVLVFNGIPCKNSSNVIGMYDTVSQTFFTNQGTGNFTAGPNAVPSPDTPIDIVSNNGVLRARHQSGLPTGYKLLQSIRNNSTAILDTGIKLASTDVVETRFFNNSDTGYGAWYGVYASGENTAFYANQTYYGYDGSNNKVNTQVAVDMDGHSVVHDFVNGKLTLDGVDTTFTPFEFANSTNNKLFCRYYNNSYGYNVKGWICYFRVKRNGVLIQNLIPCTRESDNTVGMYDLVSKTFIGPDGPDTFEEGSIATDPIGIYAEGTTETICSRGKNLFNKDGTLTNGYYKSTNGEWVSNAAFRTQDYISAQQNTSYTLTISNLQSGGNSLILSARDSQHNWLSTVTSSTAGGDAGTSTTITGTTPANTAYLSVSFAIEYRDINTLQIERGSTSTTYESYYNGGTATAEMLLKIGDYVDEQEILSGDVIRKIGVKVLDGTESRGAKDQYGRVQLTVNDLPTGDITRKLAAYCTHFENLHSSEPIGNVVPGQFYLGNPQSFYFHILENDVTGFKTWLASQYAAGTPVIVIYPLKEDVEDSTTGQALNITNGSNTIEITQASIDNLGLYAKYKATE